MADRWAYPSLDPWIPGLNIPALRKGGHHGGVSLNAVGLQFFGNCVVNSERLPDHLRLELYKIFTGNTMVSKVDAVGFVAMLGGVSTKTARGWKNALEQKGWAAAFTPGRGSRDACGKTQIQEAVGSAEAHSDESALPDVLPAIADPAEKSDEGSEGSECDLDAAVGARSAHRQLDIWREHPNFRIGMRVAELSTMWLVHGWQKDAFPQFTHWLSQQVPGMIGNLNHSTRWLNGFLASMNQACHTCTASSLHAVVPATGMPSFLSRIIDVVSIDSTSLLPVIHVYTTTEGKLSWALLGCPCLEYTTPKHQQEAALGASQHEAAVGATPKRWFGLHSAEQLVDTVHREEKSFHMDRSDRAYRLLVTVADQAIQGDGSVRFTQKECSKDMLAVKPLAEGVCKFHVSDGVGTNVDKHFRETFVFDRLLRLVRRHFAYGTGNLIYRAIAEKFASIVRYFCEKEQQCREAVARAEANGQPLAATRMHAQAGKCKAEADAIVRAGWSKWRKPLAPKADGTRKAVYQNKARNSLFETFGLTYWGLQARMQQTLESVRVARMAKGKTVTAKTGLATKEMKAWRSLGRAMLDIRLLVFNLGRVDFRRRHLAAYALDSQITLNLVPGDAAYVCSRDMLAAVGALVEMRGIIRMMSQLCSGLIFELRGNCGVIKQLNDGPWGKKNTQTAMWMTCKTLLVHRCWRYFPSLSLKLTEILLGGSFKGVKLQNEIFSEPGEPPAFGGPNKWQRGALRRQERFDHATHALDRLMQWACAERRSFMHRTMGVTPPTSKRVQQGLSPDLPSVDNADVIGVRALSESDESGAEDVEPDELETRCYFLRPAGGQPLAAPHADTMVDLMADSILPANSVAEAALDLDNECSKLYGLPMSLPAEDIADILTSCSNHDSHGEGKPDTEDSNRDSDSDSDSDRETTYGHVGKKDSLGESAVGDSESAVGNTLQDMAEVKRLGHAFMTSKGQRPQGSAPSEQERRAFLSLPRHDWMISAGKKKGTIMCLHADV